MQAVSSVPVKFNFHIANPNRMLLSKEQASPHLYGNRHLLNRPIEFKATIKVRIVDWPNENEERHLVSNKNRLRLQGDESSSDEELPNNYSVDLSISTEDNVQEIGDLSFNQSHAGSTKCSLESARSNCSENKKF